jgi:hypothetical protein
MVRSATRDRTDPLAPRAALLLLRPPATQCAVQLPGHRKQAALKDQRYGAFLLFIH